MPSDASMDVSHSGGCGVRRSGPNDRTATMPATSCSTASTCSQFSRHRMNGVTMALPIAMPASTNASISVKT